MHCSFFFKWFFLFFWFLGHRGHFRSDLVWPILHVHRAGNYTTWVFFRIFIFVIYTPNKKIKKWKKTIPIGKCYTAVTFPNKNTIFFQANVISFTRKDTLLFVWRCCLACCSYISPLRAKKSCDISEQNSALSKFLYQPCAFLYRFWKIAS